MNIFRVTNKAQRSIYIATDSKEEALKIAKDCKLVRDIKNASAKEVSQEMIDLYKDSPYHRMSIEKIIKEDKKGCIHLRISDIPEWIIL